MEHTPFSVAVDEANVKGGTPYLAVTLRYYETEVALSTKTKLLALIEIQGSSTGETLFKLMDDLIFSDSVSRDRRILNFMGIASDKASNMISGGNFGLTNRLKSKYSHILVVHDLCHAFNLILQDCFKSFPVEIKNIIEDISALFSRSPKGSAKLKAIMKAKAKKDPNYRPHTLKRYVKTRWTSFQDTVERILEQAAALEEYFKNENDTVREGYFSSSNITVLKLFQSLSKKLQK